MEPEFKINDQILFKQSRTQQLLDDGIITTIFTNKKPKKYIAQTNKNNKYQFIKNQMKSNKQCLNINDHSYNIEFQRILSQLIMQKNEDQLIEQLKTLLNRITFDQVIQAQNGPKIIYTTYKFLIMRKPSIIRNYPFITINLVIKQLKKLIIQIKKQLLQNFNLNSQQQYSIKQKSSKENQITFKQMKEIKQIQKIQSICEDSEKDEQPTAFYENFISNSSSFRPYKIDIKNHKLEQISLSETKATPKIDQIKNIYFKPIILLGPASHLQY
ncbi:unnamed protein product [Paramecium primaurelia]|uniref:Uncharacterized protein n=1 Tax=Paramecium primaurelia TaxID=5886 RepID=A0A8S1PK12_PARPR|nr:unnamed protein product [Paramecium primaurelia]